MRFANVLSKLLTACAALCLCLLVIPQVSAETVGGQCGETAYWSFDSEKGILTIEGEGDVTIPYRCYDEWGICRVP